MLDWVKLKADAAAEMNRIAATNTGVALLALNSQEFNINLGPENAHILASICQKILQDSTAPGSVRSLAATLEAGIEAWFRAKGAVAICQLIRLGREDLQGKAKG